jgi:hypothetical protein
VDASAVRRPGAIRRPWMAIRHRRVVPTRIRPVPVTVGGARVVPVVGAGVPRVPRPVGVTVPARGPVPAPLVRVAGVTSAVRTARAVPFIPIMATVRALVVRATAPFRRAVTFGRGHRRRQKGRPKRQRGNECSRSHGKPPVSLPGTEPACAGRPGQRHSRDDCVPGGKGGKGRSRSLRDCESTTYGARRPPIVPPRAQWGVAWSGQFVGGATPPRSGPWTPRPRSPRGSPRCRGRAALRPR